MPTREHFRPAQARALEGKTQYPALVPPRPEQFTSSPPGEFVNRFRIRIDPIKAKDTDAVIQFVFRDADNEAVALHVRRGVAEYIEQPEAHYRKPDFTLVLARGTWAKIYLNEANVAQLHSSGELEISGDADACGQIFALFDAFGQ